MKAISLNTMWQLVRFYWRIEKRTYLRLFLIIFSIFSFKRAVLDVLLTRIDNLRYVFNEEWLYWGFILITVSYLFAAVHHKQRAIDCLTLPANPVEKFLVRVVVGTIGIILMAFVARVAANLLVILYCGIMNLLMGNPPEWGQLIRYFLVPGQWQIAAFFYGEMSLGLFLSILLWTLPLILWPLSWFTLFGLWFRRIGWVYAFISMLVITLLLYLVMEIWLRDWILLHRQTVATSVTIILLLLSFVHYMLAFQSYRHAQIVNSKRVQL